MKNEAKRKAGQLGGLATIARHGRQRMASIGRREAETLWRRYHLAPAGISGWALVERSTNKVVTLIGHIPGR